MTRLIVVVLPRQLLAQGGNRTLGG
jgi:hypothetical protein